MRKKTFLQEYFLAVVCFMAATAAHAEPGDGEAVAKARKDYAQAMQGHDIGIQNAMKIELAVQLAKAKEREAKKNVSGATQRPASGN